MAQQPPPKPPGPAPGSEVDDSLLRRGRELVSAILALLIVGGTILLMVYAFRYVSADDTKDQSFQHAKDLLNFVTPLLGVVVGYYFNKVSTENRAESAERTAQTATANAYQATEARQEAEAEAKEAKTSLNEVSAAAEKLLNTEDSEGLLRGPSSSGSSSSGGSALEARLELQSALARARRLI